MNDVDAIDRRLIHLLQDDPRASYASLARATDLSETTVRRRVEALLASGAITLTMLPDLYRLGYRGVALAGLTVDPGHLTAITDALRGCPEIIMVAPTLGRYDAMIIVALPTLDELAAFLAGPLAAIPGIRAAEPFVIPRLLKVLGDWRVPLADLLPGEGRDDRRTASGEGRA